jgi:PD-(D/E)XK nuclease superfamily
MQTPDIEQKLLDLVNDLDRFRQDRWFSQELNIFKAVGLYRQEIRHSNFLAFLLSPQQNHGLKDGFLRRLIQKASDKFAGDPPITPLKIALADFSDAIVSREWRNIDVLVESKTNQFIFAIENKIDSIEGQRQLENYEKVVCAEFPSHARLFSYLTADGSPASRETWSAISYSDVIEALTETLQRSSNLTAPARMVVDHYVDLIRRNIVPDQALIDQCRRLYLLHKDALDLIIEYGQVNSFVSAANSFLDKHPELEKFQIRPSQAAFLPRSFLERVPPIEGTNWWGQARPLALWFNFYDGRIGIILEVGPFSNDKFSREVLVKALQEYFNSKAKIYPKYTRVYSRYIKLTEDQLSNSEEMIAAMESLYKETADKHLMSVVGIVGKFFGGLSNKQSK